MRNFQNDPHSEAYTCTPYLVNCQGAELKENTFETGLNADAGETIRTDASNIFGSDATSNMPEASRGSDSSMNLRGEAVQVFFFTPAR